MRDQWRSMVHSVSGSNSILFVNRVFPPAGGATGRLLLEAVQAFLARGWRVTVVARLPAAAESMPVEPVLRHPGFTLVSAGGQRASPQPPGAREYLGALAGLGLAALAQPRHDVAVTMTDPPMLALVGPWLRRRHGTALIHWCQDLYPDLFPVLGVGPSGPVLQGLRRASRAALAGYDRIVAIGRCMAERLIDGGLPRDRVVVVPNWPQASLLSAQPPAMPSGMQTGRAGPLRLLYAGNLGLAHPPEPLVDLAERLAAGAVDARLTVMAGGRRLSSLQARLSGLDPARVELLASQPDAAATARMRSADLHLAVLAEAAVGMMVPCKVVAALGAGRPVIFRGPADSEAARLLRETGAGLVVPADAPDGLAAAVAGLAADRDRLHALTRAAAAARARMIAAPATAALVAVATELARARHPLPTIRPVLAGAGLPPG